MKRAFIPALVLVASLIVQNLLTAAENTPFFIGTYTGGASEGIYASSLSPSDGSLAQPKLVAKLENPSFLVIHPTQKVLYAVSEVSAGEVVAYAIQANHELKELNRTSTGGSAPCHISIDATGSVAMIANYGGGSIMAVELKEDGSLGKTKLIQHEGSSVHPRQKAPHGHCILPDPSNKFACAVDLGLDQVLIYPIDTSAKTLKDQHAALKVAPGSGPRHIAFHPDNKHAFVIHELVCRLSVCDWDSSKGSLTESQVISTLPGEFQNGFSTAEVLVHPSGKFVYGSNRGHDSIAGFRFDGEKLAAIGHTPTGGKTPRNFRIDPTGTFLLTENQISDSICCFKIDTATGKLSQTSHQLEVGTPVCIKFYTH
ncbi:MAG: lactonase family protein [Planctomycetota bacterium]